MTGETHESMANTGVLPNNFNEAGTLDASPTLDDEAQKLIATILQKKAHDKEPNDFLLYEQLTQTVKDNPKLAKDLLPASFHATALEHATPLQTIIHHTPEALEPALVIAFVDRVLKGEDIPSVLTKPKCFDSIAAIIQVRPDFAPDLIYPAFNAQLSGYGRMLQTITNVAPNIFNAQQVSAFATAIDSIDNPWLFGEKHQSEKALDAILSKRPDIGEALRVESREPIAYTI